MACGIVKFLLPPTAIHSAVYCHFFNKREKCLVVAGLNFIQVYRLNVVHSSLPVANADVNMEDVSAVTAPPAAPTSTARPSSPAFDDEDDLYGPSKNVEPPKLTAPEVKIVTTFPLVSAENIRLECVASFELFGTITDLKSATMGTSNRDVLLLSFTDAKLSVVQYDPVVNDLRSISLHDYEAAKYSDEMPTNLGAAKPCMAVDPENRCAVMRLYRTHLLVVPFVHPPARSDNSLNGPKPATQLKSFALNLKRIKDETAEFIQDIQMLPGYLEPTVAVLIHRSLSFAGRIAVSADTCYVAAISLNTHEKTYHLIWSCTGLPYNSHYLRNVPRPIGGLLVVSTSSIIYVQQGVQSHGVSVNSLAVGGARFSLKPVPNVVAVLDGSQCTFFEPERLLLALRNGTAFVVTLVYDSATRNIRDFHWQQVLVNRYVSCITHLEGGYIFTGGKMSDSYLYSYLTSQWIEADGAYLDGDPNAAAHQRSLLPKKPLLDRIEDDFIYGPEAHVTIVTSLKKYHFIACDSILNVGPCRTTAVGEPINTLEDFTRTPDKDADLVTSSGYENESYVCAMHRTIRPDVVASFDLHGAENIWTLRSSGATYHEYVVITTVGRTAVFQSGEEISEDVEHPFRVDERTIFCGLINDGRTPVQVTRFHVRIACAAADSGAVVTELELAEGEEIAFATEGGGNRLAVLTTLGKLWLFEWHSATDSLIPSNHRELSNIAAVSFFTDRSGIFTSSLPRDVGTIDMEIEPEKPVLERMESIPEPEEDELYGLYSTQNEKSDNTHREKRFTRTQEELHQFLQEERVNAMLYGSSEWLLVVHRDSTLSIFSLPDLVVVFEASSILHAPRVIHDVRALDQLSVPPELIDSACADMRIREVLLLGLGSRGTQPYLFVVINEDIHVYHAVPFHYGRDGARLRISFSKVKHEMLTRERRLKRQKLPKEHTEVDDRLAKRHLRPFHDIGGYSGVFLCFPYSFFVMATDRNVLRFHPMVVDGPIKAFAEFSNASCAAGFVYYNSRKQIRVAQLEPGWNYDFNWPMTKIRVPGTVHHLSYHLECKAYVVCSSLFYPEKRMIIGGVDNVEEEVVERDPRFVYPQAPRFSLHLITPDEWQLVPEVSYQLPDFEHITGMKVLALRNGTETGMKEYVVMASNMSYGEDVQSRGRLILIDVLDLIPEPDKPLTRFKMKEIYAEEQKGPVTAICGVNGYIVSAIGQKIFIWTLKGATLVGVAFLDTQIYVHQLTAIKDLILVADIQRSTSILRFQEKYRTLSLVASDPNQMHTYATEFCVDNQNLTVAVTDIRQDLHIFQFDPDYYFSSFGNRLVRRMECNLGQYVTNMFRFHCAAWYPDAERVGHLALTKKHVTMFTTLEGAVGCYVNIPEKTYRRVLMIETILSNHCNHRAGLSPRLYWNAKTSADERFDLVGNIKTVADGKVLSLFMELDYTEQHEVAAKIGCVVDTLVEELLDIDRQTSLF